MSCFFINGGSVRKYCLRNGIDYFRFYYWMDRGCTVEEALDMAKKSAEKGHRNTKHFYNGVPLIEYCRKHKLCYNVILKRYMNGYSMEEAIKRKFKKTGMKAKYTYRGCSLLNFCNKNKISYFSVYNKMLKGFKLNDIMDNIMKIRGDKNGKQ